MKNFNFCQFHDYTFKSSRLQLYFKIVALNLLYATFKVRKFDSSFYKINTFLQKLTTCPGLQTEQILSVNL